MTPMDATPETKSPISMMQPYPSARESYEANTPPPALDGAPTFMGLFQALRRRWLLAFGLAILGAGAVVAAVFWMFPPLFYSAAIFRVASKSDASPFSVSDDSEFAIYKMSQQAMLTSHHVIHRALKEKLPDGREVTELPLVQNKGLSIVEWLGKAIKTDYQPGPEYMRVQLGAEDAEEVLAILNAIVKAYLAESAEPERLKREQRLNEFKEKKEKLDEDHRKLLSQMSRLIANKDIVDRDTRNSQYFQAMNDLSQAKTSMRSLMSRRDETQTKLAATQTRIKILPDTPIPTERMDEMLRNDPIAGLLMKQLQDFATEADYIQKNAVNPEPFLKQLNERSKDVEKKLDQRRKIVRPEVEVRFRQKLREDLNEQEAVTRGELNSLQTQQKTLNDEIGELTTRTKALEPARQVEPLEVQVLREKVKHSETSLADISNKISIYEFETPRTRVTLWQEPTLARDRDSSRQIKMAGGAGFAIFGMLLLGVAFVEFRSRRISAADDITTGLRLPVIGSLPAMPTARALGETGSLRQQLFQNQLSEAIDSVRTVLLHSSKASALRVILVTSAESGEGKSTLATQLASSLSRAWRNTLLIDGNLRQPAAHLMLGVNPEPGLSEVLRGEVSVEDAVQASSQSRLWVLPAGNCNRHALQAMAQEDVKKIFDVLKEHYEFIIVDSPAVLPFADTMLLGQHVDGIMFSVLRDISRTPSLYAAQQKLQPLGIRTLGAVVIGAPAERKNQQY